MKPYDAGYGDGLKANLKLHNAELSELREAVAYAIGRLDRESEGCPVDGDLADELRKLADERAGWIEVAVQSNRDLTAFLEANGVPSPYGMPVDGVSQLYRAARAQAEGGE